jgi:thioredoxin 1
MIEITDDEFEKEVLQSTVPVVVDFWAPWCGPCRASLSYIEALSKKVEGVVKIVKMNVDDNKIVSAKYEVRSIPTFLVFNQGQVVKKHVGFSDGSGILKDLEEITTKKFTD